MSQEIPVLHRQEGFLIKINEGRAFSWCTRLDAASHFISLCQRNTVWEPPRLWHGGLNPAVMPQTAFVRRRKEHVSKGS